MIGTSEPIRRVFAAIRKVATTDVPVLIIGESGTGTPLRTRTIYRPRGEVEEWRWKRAFVS